MFADIAPGDHVEVRISGAALADENAASSALLQAEAMASTQAADAERSAATAAAAAALAALAMAVWALVEADGWDGAVPRGSGGAGIGSATLDSAATANVGRHRGRRRRNGRPVLTATITRVVHSVGSGRGGWTWEELTVTMTDTIAFQLDTGAWHADVYTKGMTWAAPPVRQPVDEKRAIRAVAAVCPGDRVRVLARTGEAGDNDIRAGGPESLFLIAGTPSDFLRRALRPPLAILAYVGLAIASTLL